MKPRTVLDLWSMFAASQMVKAAHDDGAMLFFLRLGCRFTTGSNAAFFLPITGPSSQAETGRDPSTVTRLKR